MGAKTGSGSATLGASGTEFGDGRVHAVHAGRREEPDGRQVDHYSAVLVVDGPSQRLRKRPPAADVDLASDPDVHVAVGPLHDLDVDHAARLPNVPCSAPGRGINDHGHSPGYG
jgi:hypothetical protein